MEEKENKEKIKRIRKQKIRALSVINYLRTGSMKIILSFDWAEHSTLKIRFLLILVGVI